MIHWEFMFTRPLFRTADMARQGDMLNEGAGLLNAGRIKSTATETLGTVCTENLRRAHLTVASGKARGKLVLEGF